MKDRKNWSNWDSSEGKGSQGETKQRFCRSKKSFFSDVIFTKRTSNIIRRKRNYSLFMNCGVLFVAELNNQLFHLSLWKNKRLTEIKFGCYLIEPFPATLHNDFDVFLHTVVFAHKNSNAVLPITLEQCCGTRFMSGNSKNKQMQARETDLLDKLRECI